MNLVLNSYEVHMLPTGVIIWAIIWVILWVTIWLTIWLLIHLGCGIHMSSIWIYRWNPYGNHTKCMHQVDVIWNACANHTIVISFQHGHLFGTHMQSIWNPFGNHINSHMFPINFTWFPWSFQMNQPYEHHLQTILLSHVFHTSPNEIAYSFWHGFRMPGHILEHMVFLWLSGAAFVFFC